MPTYQLGEHPEFEARVVDEDGVLLDPATVTISIRAPDRSMAVTNQIMTNESTGIYTYVYVIPGESSGIPGTYAVRVTATGAGGRVTISTDEFDVEVSI